MGNLPISAHITVVSTTPSAIPDAANVPLTGAGASTEGSDFSNLLAGQIAAKVEALTGGKPETAPPEVVEDEAALSLPANTDVAAGGIVVVGFIPPPTLPAAVLKAAGAEFGADASRLELGRGLNLIEARQGAATGVDAVVPESGESSELPANFAAQSSALPLKGLGESVREALFAEEGGVKSFARPELSDANPAERVPGLMAHGIVSAKMDTVAAGQATPLPTVAVENRVGAPGWGAELGQKVVWLANQQQQVAQINVTPPQLGPIEIRLNLSSDQASAIFVSPHAAVRDAIEAALPRLREMLAESGLTLGNVDVSPHSFGHPQQGQAQSGDKSRNLVPELAAVHAGDSGLHLGTLPGATRGGQGLVDIFA